MISLVRRVGRVALLVSIAVLPAPSWAASKASCLGDFAKIIEGSLSSEGERAVTKAYARYSPKARKGILSVIVGEPAVSKLEPDVLEGIFGNFPPGVEFDFNPLKTDQGLFEAIADLTDQGADGVLRMRDGLTDVIKDLGGQSLKAQGASFDLFMAQEIGPSRAKAFQQRIGVPGTSKNRITDLVEEGGILHENKNFTTPITASADDLINPKIDPQFPDFFKYGDAKLDTLASEFAEDILIHQGDGFDLYRLNLRRFNDTAAQRDVLRQVMLQQFDSPLVKNVLSQAERDAARATFLSKIDALISYHP